MLFHCCKTLERLTCNCNCIETPASSCIQMSHFEFGKSAVCLPEISCTSNSEGVNLSVNFPWITCSPSERFRGGGGPVTNPRRRTCRTEGKAILLANDNMEGGTWDSLRLGGVEEVRIAFLGISIAKFVGSNFRRTSTTAIS